MSDVFISYVEEDSGLAVELAQGLKQLGYSTWYDGEDSIPGVKYLLQTREAIEACRAVVLLISENSLSKRILDLQAYAHFHPLHLSFHVGHDYPNF